MGTSSRPSATVAGFTSDEFRHVQVEFFESQCVFLLHAMECLRLVCFGK
jgi:hypothetical protein